MILTVDNLGEWGVLQDGLPHELPDNAFSDGRNVRFREGYAEKFAGHTTAFGASDFVPYHVTPLQVGDTRWWIEAGLTALCSVDNDAVRTDITRAGGPYTGTADDRWTSTTLSGIAVLNNGVDVPQAWAGSGVAVDLANWPATLRAKSVRAFRNYLVAVGVSKSGVQYPHMVKWSHSADPGTVPSSWDETDATVEAGEFDLADTPGELVDALVLGDALILYKEGSYYRLDWVGGGYVFQSRLVSSEYGMLARNCAAAYPGGHVVLGQGDVFIHAGGPPQTILTARARRWLFDNMDAQAYDRSFVAANPLANEVWICFPSISKTSCDTALVWNWNHNTLGVRDLPNLWHANHGVVDTNLANSWDTLYEPWAALMFKWNQSQTTKSATRLVMASNNQAMYLADSSSSFSGTAMPVKLERTGISLGEPDRFKLLKSLRPIFEGADGSTVTITFGAANEPNTEPTWGTPQSFVIGTDYQADSFAAGRYLALRIESDTRINWRLKRLALEVEMQGRY